MEIEKVNTNVYEIFEYQELYKLYTGKLKVDNDKLKINFTGNSLTKENMDNFWKIIKHLPTNFTSMEISFKEIILTKGIKNDDIVFFSFDEFPRHIKKFFYKFTYTQNCCVTHYEKIMKQIVKMPNTIDEFLINLDQSFQMQLQNAELGIKFEILEHKDLQSFPTFKDNFQQFLSNFSQKFTQLDITIENSGNFDFEGLSLIYQALSFTPNNLKCLYIKSECNETQQSIQSLKDSLKVFSKQLEALSLGLKYLKQRLKGLLDSELVSLQNYSPSIKLVSLIKENYTFQKSRDEFLLILEGDNIEEQQITQVIPQLKDGFQMKEIQHIKIKFDNLLALTMNHIQLLAQQIQYIHSRVKSVKIKIQWVNSDNMNNFISTISNTFQQLPRKLESLKLDISYSIANNHSLQAISANIQHLPPSLKHFQLLIGNDFQEINEHIKQLPNSLTSIFIEISDDAEFDQCSDFLNCLGIFTKQRRIKEFTIKAPNSKIYKHTCYPKILRVQIQQVQNMMNIFSQFAEETFYLEDTEILNLHIDEVLEYPTPQECEQIGNELKNISKQFTEVIITINKQYPFGQNQETLGMFFKLIDSATQRKCFQINDQNEWIYFQDKEQYSLKLCHLINFDNVTEEYFQEFEAIITNEKYQSSNLNLFFDQLSSAQRKYFKLIDRFVHPKLKWLFLSFEDCQLSDTDLPFVPSQFIQAVQTSSIESFILNLKNNQNIHNKTLERLFKGVYQWKNLKQLEINLSETNLKTKGLDQFSKLIQNQLPNLQKFILVLNKTKSEYKLLSSSIVNLIRAIGAKSCPNLLELEMQFNSMKNKFNAADLYKIGDSIKELSQTVNFFTLDLSEMIGDKQKGIKYLFQSISHLNNLKQAQIIIDQKDETYDYKTLLTVVDSLKYFNLPKLEKLIIGCISKVPGVDQNNLLLRILKQIKNVDLSRTWISLSISDLALKLGGSQYETEFILDENTITQETYDFLIKFLLQLPPTIYLQKDLQIIPRYDDGEGRGQQNNSSDNSDDEIVDEDDF